MPDTSIVGDLWPVVVAAVILLVGIGKILSMINSICNRLDKHDVAMADANNEQNDIKKQMVLFTTTAMCDRCRDACERRNAVQLGEIKRMLSDFGDKRDTMVEAIGSMSCRIGTLEGMFQRVVKELDRHNQA